MRSTWLALLLLAVAARGAELFPFVLPWDDATPSITNLSGLLEKPAGKHGFVSVKDGHLYAGEKRLRIFGVNLAFGANFPTHADAEKVAARMAKFGINCVRFHHLDTAPVPAGLLEKDFRTFNAERLDRLDYFIAQLAKNGIYTNLNLHVGNPYPTLPKWEGREKYGKGWDNFYTPAIQLQKEYARTLLTHVNPYTKLAYTADPAVAFVEINNENGLIMEWNNKTLDPLPTPLASEFDTLWNQWLQKKYATPEKLAEAWNVGAEPIGAELLPSGGQWLTEQQGGAVAQFEAGDNAVKVKVEQPGKENWHVQFNRGKLKVEAGKTYTLRARARVSEARTVSVNLSMNHAPWKVLAAQQIKLTPAWRELDVPLRASEGDNKARISFSNFGGAGAEVEFMGISLQAGGIFGLQPGEKLGQVPFFKKAESARRTDAAMADWTAFMIHTEEQYWGGMSRYIKEELGSKSLVFGTACGFSPWLVQSQLDVVDAHAYWQHPHFPGRPWDQNNWTIKNIPMAGMESGSALERLAVYRVMGKPFLVTEYNHASPNDYSAEGFLEICALAMAQDWDGVFAFAYSHRTDDWDTQRLTSFFDIDQHPTKMATLPAALALFYGCGNHLRKTHPEDVTRGQAEQAIRKSGSWASLKDHTSDWVDLFSPWPFGLRLTNTPNGVFIGSSPSSVSWDAEQQRMRMDNNDAWVVGRFSTNEAIRLGMVTLTPGASNLGWGTFTATAFGHASLLHAPRILLTLTGQVANEGMQWNAGKTSIGKAWGHAPSLVEGIPATVRLRTDEPVRAWALDTRGQRREELPVKLLDEEAVIKLGPQYRTLWYEVERHSTLR